MSLENENFQEKVYVDKMKVDMWFMSNQKYFPTEKVVYLREKLYSLDEKQFNLLYSIELKDPTVIFLISIFLGGWGVDRFMLGETGMGILKLLTGGCCGVLWIIDLFTVQNKAKELNFTNIMRLL